MLSDILPPENRLWWLKIQFTNAKGVSKTVLLFRVKEEHKMEI